MGHHANSKILINKTYNKIYKTTVKAKLLIKIELEIQKDWLETVSSISLFHSIIVLGKKENLKLSFCPFGTIQYTDVFAQKKFSKDIFNSEICSRYD